MNLMQEAIVHTDSLNHQLSLLAAETGISINKKCHVYLQADTYHIHVDFFLPFVGIKFFSTMIQLIYYK